MYINFIENCIVLNDFSSYVHQSKFTFLKLLYFRTSIIVSHSLFISHLQPIKVLTTALIFVYINSSKFRPEIYSDEEEDEEKIMKNFIEKLHSYNLFTFQSRIYNKLLMFAHSIKTNRRAPVDLRSQINLPAPEDD